MKKLLVLFAILFAVSIVSYGQEDPPTETSDRDWEPAPNILSGGYSDEEGPYVYKFVKAATSPSVLPQDGGYSTGYHWMVEYKTKIPLGYGSFSIHKHTTQEGSAPSCEIRSGDEDALDLVFYYATRYWGGEPAESYPEDGYTGTYDAYVYKKENIQHMSIAFSSESYTAQEGQRLTVNVFVIGGSGHYTGTTVKPAFLSTVGQLAYEGKCYDPVQTSISVVVKDKITGQQCAASADIIITEKTDDPDDNPNNPSNPSNPSDPSDPNNPSDPSDPSEPSEPAEPSDPSNPDSPDSPSDPTEPDSPADPTEPEPDDVPEEPMEPDNPDTPSEPTDPSNPNSPDEPNDPSEPDSPDTPDSPDDPTEPDEPVVVPDPEVPDEPVVVPDNPETPDEPEDSEPSDISDESDEVIIIDPTSPGNDDDEPTIIVVDRESSDSDKIIVTDDGVTRGRRDNHDLAVFMGMFGAMTSLSGSAAVPESAPVAVQEAMEGKSHE